MAKIRTLDQLQEKLDADMGWRIKEISQFKIATKANNDSARTFVRAGVVLLYAHWEGYIKSASENYLNYVVYQGHIYRELKTCFAVFGLKGKLSAINISMKARANIEALEFVLTGMDKPAQMNMASAIDTESNLTSKVFQNIAISIEIDTTPYETRFKMIDESLVGRRNKVAHGEYIDLDIDDFFTLVDDVLNIMRNYKTDIQNAASLKRYKRATTGATYTIKPGSR